MSTHIKNILPDATQHNPSPENFLELLKRANMSQRGVARVLGLAERTARNYASGESEVPYAVQYCLEVIARGGVADTPQAPSVWFKTGQRPLREADAGRIVVGRDLGGLYIFGRVGSDGFGMVVESLPGTGVDGKIIGASALADYVLVDDAGG